ncbi:MAG: hypothetical protein CXT78_15480, partial [Thaumarchaeota archaeon]
MLNKSTDINNKSVPIITKIIPIIVNGIEKYLVSLNNIMTFTPKIIPIIVIMIPGIPTNFKGDFTAII